VISPGTFLANIGFGGANSVEIFFVISGFYIALILDQKYQKVIVFYINRALRIYPTYFAVCGVVLVVCLFSSTIREDMFNYPGITLVVATLSNLTLFGIDGIMFLQWNDNKLNFGNFNFSELPLWHMLWVPQAWSLGVEVTFYICAPLLCKLKSKHLITLVFFLISLRITAWTILDLDKDPWSYRFFPFELPLFLIGVLLYRLKAQGRVRLSVNVRLLNTITVIVFMVFGFAVFKSFESPIVTKTGEIPYPRKNEVMLGGHAAMLVGYDDKKQCFIIRNSWGTKWGLKGYGWISYKYILDQNLTTSYYTIMKTT
jgi:peptidoglycan/LPS O-acetylase OafA/YrhL